eukprot:361839-Chlamydomonas_euryale.AAC.18
MHVRCARGDMQARRDASSCPASGAAELLRATCKHTRADHFAERAVKQASAKHWPASRRGPAGKCDTWPCRQVRHMALPASATRGRAACGTYHADRHPFDAGRLEERQDAWAAVLWFKVVLAVVNQPVDLQAPYIIMNASPQQQPLLQYTPPQLLCSPLMCATICPSLRQHSPHCNNMPPH